MYKVSHVKELRERRGLTQVEACKLSGVSRATLARLEAGRTAARPETARALAKVLRAKPEQL